MCCRAAAIPKGLPRKGKGTEPQEAAKGPRNGAARGRQKSREAEPREAAEGGKAKRAERKLYHLVIFYWLFKNCAFR